MISQFNKDVERNQDDFKIVWHEQYIYITHANYLE